MNCLDCHFDNKFEEYICLYINNSLKRELQALKESPYINSSLEGLLRGKYHFTDFRMAGITNHSF